MVSQTKANVIIEELHDQEVVRIRWRNPLPENAGLAWGILILIVVVIWAGLLSALLSVDEAPAGLRKAKNLFLLLFCIPMSLATITMFTLAVRATFGNRTESIKIDGDELVYLGASPSSYLFFGDGAEDAQMSRYAGSLPNAVAAAISDRKEVRILRSELSQIDSNDR